MIPARDEEHTVGLLVRALRSALDSQCRVVVVDNASTDATYGEAVDAGADLVIRERSIGKGFAVRAGLAASEPGSVFVCDADIVGLERPMINELARASSASGCPVVRLAIGRSPSGAPVTTLVARPLLDLLGPSGCSVREPIGGLVVVNRDFVLDQHLPGGWGFDFALTMCVLRQGLALPEISVEGVSHRQRPLEAYIDMSSEVVRAGLVAAGHLPWSHKDCIRCGEAAQGCP